MSTAADDAPHLSSFDSSRLAHLAEPPPRLGRVLWVIIAVSLGVHAACLIAGNTFLHDWRWPHHPVHAAVEMSGGLIALWVAWMLLSLERRQVGTSFNVWIAGALIGMGLLDGMHALVHVGQEFVWLHSTATFVGGALFVCVWAPEGWGHRVATWWAWAVFIAVFVFGLFSLALSDMTPQMLVENEQGVKVFTIWAQALNVAGGVLLFAAAARLVTTWFRTRNVDDLLFCLHCSLFGAAAIMFEQSELWDLPWWGWHLLRLMAYGVAIWFVVLTESREQQALLRQADDLRRAGRQFQATVEASPTAMVMIDRQGTILLLNAHAEQLFGYERKELLGERVEILMPERFRPQHPSLRDGFFAVPESREMGTGQELFGLRKDGSEFPIEVGLGKIETDRGLLVLAVLSDVTDRKRLEEIRKAELEFAYVGASERVATTREKSAIIRQTGDDLAGIEGLDDAMDVWARQARTVIGAHQSAVSYVPRGNIPAGKHAVSLSEKYGKYRTYDVLPTGEGIWRLIVNEKCSFCMTDEQLKSHPAWKNFSNLRDERGLEHPPMRGWLATPVLSRNGECIGLLQLSDKYDGDFAQKDLDSLSRLAQLIAPTFSLQNANEQLQRHSEELAEAKDALEQSNVELQQFAYVASHDLQTPLRAVAGFAQFLQQDYQGQLDEKADERIGRIVNGCIRMQTMINDLLTISRVQSRAAPFQLISLNELFDDAVTLLHASIEDTGGEVTRGELARVNGDRPQLSQLLQNLIGNGLKYHGDVPPRVHVSAEKNGSVWTIAVCDNGIGIDAKHHERIFEIFRRLHTQEKYPGTGIGLAVCRRIVYRHGGRIWLESEPGKGTTFYFTIPVRGNARQES